MLCKFFRPCWNSVNLDLAAQNKRVLGLLRAQRDSWSETCKAGVSADKRWELRRVPQDDQGMSLEANTTSSREKCGNQTEAESWPENSGFV